MKKSIKKCIDADDIRDFLLTHDDFALELFVYNKALANNFEVTHGGTYTDPITNKIRQYDVRANKILKDARIALSIECKSLKKSYPLLVSRLKRIKEESFHQYIYSKVRDSNSLVPHFFYGSVVTLDGFKTIYKVGDYVGKSTVQIGRNDQDEFIFGDGEAYDKWSQALNSANDLVYSSYDFLLYSHVQVSTAIIPVLVVPDETLWVVDYSDDGTMQREPEQVDEAQLFINRKYQFSLYPTYQISHLHIYTKKGICTLLEKIANDEKYWNLLFFNIQNSFR